ncbi:GNAT family N-acetyltransferase [Polymorphospora rubra]
MPTLAGPALPAGALRGLAQPHLIVDDGLVLRPWRVDDAVVVRAAFDCPVIRRWHARRIDSDDEAREWIAGWAGRWADETDASWAVVDGRDAPVGQVGLRTVSLSEGVAQLSYWVLPAARGGGVAGRAARAMAAWTFGTLGLHRLELRHSVGNLASCRVAGRAGFGLEGTARGATLHADGWHDMHVHARLRTDTASATGVKPVDGADAGG